MNNQQQRYLAYGIAGILILLLSFFTGSNYGEKKMMHSIFPDGKHYYGCSGFGDGFLVGLQLCQFRDVGVSQLLFYFQQYSKV